MPGIIEQPDRPRAQREAERRYGWVVSVQSVVDFECEREEDEIRARRHRLRMQWLDDEEGTP